MLASSSDGLGICRIELGRKPKGHIWGYAAREGRVKGRGRRGSKEGGREEREGVAGHGEARTQPALANVLGGSILE